MAEEKKQEPKPQKLVETHITYNPNSEPKSRPVIQQVPERIKKGV